MARTYLGVWNTYWVGTNRSTPDDIDTRGRWKFYYEQNKANMTTTVTVEHYMQRYNAGPQDTYYISAASSKATVNGSSSTKSIGGANTTLPTGYSERLMGTSTFTIQHDSQGKANLVFSGSHTSSPITRSAAHTWTLPDIEVSSTISANVAEQTLGNQITFTIVPKEQTYVHVLKYKYGTSSETQIATNVGTSYNWTPSVNLAQYVTNNTYGTATIYCYSYDGSVSDANYKGYSTTTVKLNIPDSVKPSGTLAVTDVNTTSTNETGKVPASWGILVKGFSKLKLQASLTMSQGATLTSVLMTACDGQSGTTNPFTSPQNVATSGTSLANTCFVTDSRGRNATITTNSNIYDYENPSVTLNIVRANSDGTYNANGENAKATITYAISSLNSKNAKHYVLKYRAKGSSTYTNIYNVDLSNYSGTLSLNINTITFDTGTTYEFVVTVNDQFNSTEGTATMAYSRKPISVKKTKGVTFGRHAVDDGFNVYYNADFKLAITKQGNTVYGCKVLYESQSGTTGDVTLNDNVADYSFIEIFGMDDNSKKGAYTKIADPKPNDIIMLSYTRYPSTAHGNTSIDRKQFTVGGVNTGETNKLIVVHSGNVFVNSNGAVSVNQTQNSIYVYKVVGWL